MSFNKRIITKESLQQTFNSYGLIGVERLFQADAVVLSGDHIELLNEIHESLIHLDLEKTQKLITKIILL